MQIVVLDGFTLNPGDLSWESMESLGNLTVHDRTAYSEVVDRAGNAEAIFTNKVVIDSAILDKLPHLKFIGVLATGYNVVDTTAAKKAGVTVTNIPAYSTASVAQMVFAHILHFTNRVAHHAFEVSKGRWAGHSDFSFWDTPQTELAGKTLGIIGFGRIGQEVARIGDAFGMRIVFHNRSPKTGYPIQWQQLGTDELLGISDFVSINTPLTAENQEFVNAKLLAKMKPTAFLINTGRGALVNEADLAEALNSDRLAGAGLDVLSTEPPHPDNPLLTAKNCFITPHIAWATLEARTRLMEIAVNNLRQYINGAPVNVVN